jgi:hypothetical protein
MAADRAKSVFQRIEATARRWKDQQNLAGMKWEEVESGMKERMKIYHFVASARVEQLLTEAGFHRIQRFFRNFMLGGWIAFKR